MVIMDFKSTLLTRTFFTRALIVLVFLENPGICPADELNVSDKPQPILQRCRVDVQIMEVGPEKIPESNTDQERKRIQDLLAGPAPDLFKKVPDLMSKGLITGTRGLTMKVVERQLFSTYTSEMKSFTMDALRLKIGKVATIKITTETQMGLEGKVKSLKDNKAEVELFYFEKKAYPVSVYPRDDKGNREEKGPPVQIHRFIAYTLKTKLTVPVGQAVAIPGVKVAMWAESGRIQELKSEQSRIVVFVSIEAIK